METYETAYSANILATHNSISKIKKAIDKIIINLPLLEDFINKFKASNQMTQQNQELLEAFQLTWIIELAAQEVQLQKLKEVLIEFTKRHHSNTKIKLN